MRTLILTLLFSLIPLNASALLGEDIGPLLKLIAGQVTEIERLTETLNIARENRAMLLTINEGILRTVNQIENVQSIIERAQNLDPKAIHSISDLNDYLSRVEGIKHSIDEVLLLKTQAAGVAVSQAAAQSDTAYLMGQEMIGTGSSLAEESRTASPGRAAQITASTNSAQMLAKGVELQTLAQIAQVTAMSLELQRSQIEASLQEKKASSAYFTSQVTPKKRSAK